MSGRTTKRKTDQVNGGPPSLRQRSPWAFWMAVLVLAGMVASILAGVVAGFIR